MKRKKALMLAPMGSVHRRFNKVNIDVLKALGYEVHLVANFTVREGTEKQNGEYISDCKKQGIMIHNIEYKRHSLIENLACIKYTKELLKSVQFNIVHAHTETGGLILRLCGRCTNNCNYIYTPHGMSFYEGSNLKSQLMYRPVERWICSLMNKNIAINEEEYKVLREWNSNTAHLVHGIGLDLTRFSKDRNQKYSLRDEENIPQNAFVILSIGELDDNKNHATIVKALSMINRQEVYYVICGVGPNKGKLEDLAEKHKLKDRIKLLGYRDNIPDIILQSDIFAFPSIHEGLPVSVMEAMAGGLPIVCSRIRGNVDLIKDNEGGFLCESESPQDFARCIIKLIDDFSIRDKMKTSNIININKYSYDNVKNELFEIYKD